MKNENMVILNNVILQNGKDAPYMQGDTTLPDNKTIEYNGEKSLSVLCSCGKPFIESLMLNGIVNDTVVCSLCCKEIAFIVDR